MYKFLANVFLSFFIFVSLSLVNTSSVKANPYFYITGSDHFEEGEISVFKLFLNTDGDKLESFQIAVKFDEDYFDPHTIAVQNSICNKWRPAYSIPPGEDFEKITPYVFKSSIIFSCSFSKDELYNSSDGLVAIFSLKSKRAGYDFLSFQYPSFQFLSTTIRPGAMDDFIIKIGNPLFGTPAPRYKTSPTFAPAIPFTDNTTNNLQSKMKVRWLSSNIYVLLAVILIIICVFLVNLLLWLLRKKGLVGKDSKY
jgi:hypothetical protein